MYGALFCAGSRTFTQLSNIRIVNNCHTQEVANYEGLSSAHTNTTGCFLMKIQEMIGKILTGSPPLGTFPFPELLRVAAKGKTNGIAVFKEDEKEQFLAFLAGDAEGAIFIDEKGTLYGDNAVMLFTGEELLTLYDVNPELVEAVVAGCRLFEKAYLKKGKSFDMPEFGKKSTGIGIYTLTVKRDDIPQNGVRVSIRKEGKVVGSDVTTRDGSVGFRIMHGKYDVIVQDRNQHLTTYHAVFDESRTQKILQL